MSRFRPPIRAWKAEEPSAGSAAPSSASSRPPSPAPGTVRVRLRPAPLKPAEPAPPTPPAPVVAVAELPVPALSRPPQAAAKRVPAEPEPAPRPPKPPFSDFTPEDRFALERQQAGQTVGVWHWKRGPQAWSVEWIQRCDMRLAAPEIGPVKYPKILMAMLYDVRDEVELAAAVGMEPTLFALGLRPTDQPAMRHRWAAELLDQAAAEPGRRLTVHFLYGTKISGSVLEQTRYAFRLEFAPGRWVWVYRHALAALELAPAPLRKRRR